MRRCFRMKVRDSSSNANYNTLTVQRVTTTVVCLKSGLQKIQFDSAKKSSSDWLAELIGAWFFDIKCSLVLRNWLQKVEVVLNGHGQRGKKKPLRGYPTFGPSSFISLDNLLTIDRSFFIVHYHSLIPSTLTPFDRTVSSLLIVHFLSFRSTWFCLLDRLVWKMAVQFQSFGLSSCTVDLHPLRSSTWNQDRLF